MVSPATVVAGLRQPELHQRLLQTQPLGARRQHPHHGFELGERNVERGPEIELDAIPLQLRGGWVDRTGRARAVQTRVEHMLELRQATDPAVRRRVSRCKSCRPHQAQTRLAPDNNAECSHSLSRSHSWPVR
jgi:hypothetical protein